MRTAILLGAGSSLPAGFPSTQDLTDLVLSGHGFERHTDGSYIPADLAEDLLMEGRPRLAWCMTRRLYAEAESYFAIREDRRANYEDLFYLANQVWDEEMGEAENPAIRVFVDQLKAESLPLVNDWVAQDSENLTHEHEIAFKELLWETKNYIADIAWRTLAKSPQSTDHLRVFAEACKSGHVVGVSTLCHDTHLEDFLAGCDVPLADGFSDEEAGVRYWNAKFPLENITFLKLHGSVNWFQLCPDGQSLSEEDWTALDEEFHGSPPTDNANLQPTDEGFFQYRIGMPLSCDPWHTKTAGGDLQTPVGGRPILLMGTFNKIAEYTRGMFRDLHHRFRSMIQEADQLVVCGYGFGDKGINSEVIDWYYRQRGRRFVVVHPDPPSLISESRGAIRHKWRDWEKRGSVTLIRKRLEDVSLDEFMEHICA